MADEKIMAVIITFNPEIDQLCQNVQMIASQVDELAIYDNGSENISDIEKKLGHVNIIRNESNIGLPINYNRAIKIAKSNGFNWLLIMDQDTRIPDNLIKEYRKYISLDNIAIICPLYCDINICSKEEIKKRVPAERFNYVDRCISSASLNNVDVAIAMGGFDEKMFIDYVDFDYCKNCRNHSYKILRVNSCIIEHQIGQSKTVGLLWKKITCNNHPPVRKYYFARNRVYYARKYHEGFWLPAKDILVELILILYEKNRVEKIIKVCKGFIDGFKL